MTTIDENERMRNASGNVVDDRKLVVFFYFMLRDGCISPSVLEKHLDQIQLSSGKDHHYTNGWLAQYAQDIAGRLV